MKLTNSDKMVSQKNKTLKIIILTAVITTMLVSGIGVVAVKLSASDIGFTSTDENWQVNNVEDAMNDLYVLGQNASNVKIHDLGKGRKFDISDIVGSENIDNYSINNFIVSWNAPDNDLDTLIQNAYGASPSTGGYVYVVPEGVKEDFILSYDNTTGILTITGGTYDLRIVNDAGVTGYKIYENNPTVYFLDGLENK